MTYFLGHPV